MFYNKINQSGFSNALKVKRRISSGSKSFVNIILELIMRGP